MDYFEERFTNINELINTLNSRPNNSVMKGQDSSNSSDKSFTGTSNYKEAVDLLRFGYTEPLKQIKEEVRKATLVQLNKRQIRNMPIGYIPNVPNYLSNKPDSMINIISDRDKQRTIRIIYCIAGTCWQDTDFFLKNGVKLVTAINVLELSGISTALEVGFFSAEKCETCVLSTLLLKNYGQRFNLEKICFPMIHPSMFRRIGFKYIETMPDLEEPDFAQGYGRIMDYSNLKEYCKRRSEPSIPLSTSIINNMSVDQIVNILIGKEEVIND